MERKEIVCQIADYLETEEINIGEMRCYGSEPFFELNENLEDEINEKLCELTSEVIEALTEGL